LTSLLDEEHDIELWGKENCVLILCKSEEVRRFNRW
jgi:hypothetical protein